MTTDGDRELLDLLRQCGYDLTRSAADRIEQLLRIVADNEARIAELSDTINTMVDQRQHDRNMALNACNREALLRATIDNMDQLLRMASRMAQSID